MKFDSVGSKAFIEAKQYVDTLVVPLVEIGFDETLMRKAEAAEVVLAVSEETERQLTGRVLLAPSVGYIRAEQAHDQCVELVEQAREAGLRHVVFIAGDLSWKQYDLPVIYVPALSLKAMSAGQAQSLVQNFTTQVITDLTTRWMAL